MHRSIVLSAALLFFLILILPLLLRAMRRQRRRAAMDFSELLSRLEPFSRLGIEEVASDILAPSAPGIDPRSDARLTPVDVWDLVGGVRGVENLLNNAEVLIELAHYVLQWNDDAGVVAEQLRLEANDIRRDLRQIRRSLRIHALRKALGIRSAAWLIPVYAQRAAATYCLMIRQLIVLFEISNGALVQRLREAL
jgi:hypothetical protein